MKHPTKKKQTKEDLVKPSTIGKPNKEDVVLTCGKGSCHINHFGNHKCKKLVENNLFNHKNRPFAEKHAICCKTFNCITKSGSGFIQIDLHNQCVSPEGCPFFEKSCGDVRERIMMCICSAGKENLHVHHGRSPSQSFHHFVPIVQ